MAVLALPEDVLSAVLPHDVPTPLPAVLPLPAPPAASITELGALLAASKKPFLIAGGAGWSPETSEALGAFATAWSMPIGLAFRRQDCLNNLHPCYAGAFCTNFTQLLALFTIYVVSKWASCGRLYQSHPPLQLVEGLFPVFCLLKLGLAAQDMSASARTPACSHRSRRRTSSSSSAQGSAR